MMTKVAFVGAYDESVIASHCRVYDTIDNELDNSMRSRTDLSPLRYPIPIGFLFVGTT